MAFADEWDLPARDGALSALIGAGAVLAAGALALALLQLGPVSAHMAIHIASMSVVAPVAAIWLVGRHRDLWAYAGSKALWPVTLVQMALLWASHSPAFHHAAHSSLIVFTVLHVALLLSAMVFWAAIVASSMRWQAILALLLSGKLACLLGALLIFSPRVLLAASPAHGGHALPSDAGLADQHLAGLLMITACPLSYVLTAIVLAARTIFSLELASASALADGRRVSVG